MFRTELIQRVTLLKGLSPSELEPIAAAAREEMISPETNVVEIGDPGDSLYIILDGNVQVLHPARSRDFELARLGPGNFFGEMALLNDKPRSATVKTVNEARVLILKKARFREILRERPDVAVEIMEEADRNRRYGDEFALILLDVDRFETVNDTFGFDVGDEILSWIGRLLNEHTRAADAPFPVGGEEFAILAPATGGEIAGTVADRLVRVVDEARPPVDLDLHVTISGGYSTCPQHAGQPPRLFNLADQALLRARAEGCNRVCHPRPAGRG